MRNLVLIPRTARTHTRIEVMTTEYEGSTCTDARAGVRAALLGAFLLCCGACSVDLTSLRPGMSADDVTRTFGKSTWLEAPSVGAASYVRMIKACSAVDPMTVKSVWVYRRTFKRDVLVLFDANRRVLCGGHGGVSFVQ